MGIKAVNVDNISVDSISKAIEKSISSPTVTQKIISNVSEQVKNSPVSNQVPVGLANSSTGFSANKVETMNLNNTNVTVETASGKHESYNKNHTHYGSSVIKNADGSTTETWIDGGITNSETRKADGSVIKIIDRDGKITQYTMYDPSGNAKVELKSDEHTTIKKDVNGNIILESSIGKKVINKNGETISSIKYGSKDVITEKVEKLENGKTSVYKYSQDTGIKTESLYDGEKLLESRSYKGDKIISSVDTLEDGTIEKKHFDDNLQLTYHKVEKDGKVQSLLCIENNNGSTSKYEYNSETGMVKYEDPGNEQYYRTIGSYDTNTGVEIKDAYDLSGRLVRHSEIKGDTMTEQYYNYAPDGSYHLTTSEYSNGKCHELIQMCDSTGQVNNEVSSVSTYSDLQSKKNNYIENWTNNYVYR